MFEICTIFKWWLMHGGKRSGAGRKKGSNPYGESTKPVRVPTSFVEPLKQYLMQFKDTPFKKDFILPRHDLTHVLLPMFSNTVSAALFGRVCLHACLGKFMKF